MGRLRRISGRISRRIALVVATGALAGSLTGGPVVATETAPEQPPQGESRPGEKGERIPAESKAEFPLELDDPQDLVGLALLALTGAASVAAVRNVVQQLRGERPQSSGTWRPR